MERGVTCAALSALTTARVPRDHNSTLEDGAQAVAALLRSHSLAVK
jgi:hypothetical protein